MVKDKFSTLRNRAEKILKDCRKKSTGMNHDVSELIHELTLHQIELEVQNEDLIKTQVALVESQSKYIALYDLAPVGYISFNAEGLIKEINQAGCQLLGLKKDALINRCFSRYIAPTHQLLFSQYRRQAFTEKSLQSFELKLLRWKQSSFYAAVECKVVENEHTSEKQLLSFMTDITSRKLAEDALHHQRIKMAAIDRLRSVNELVYAMAQEQNNSIMMMDNYLQGCIRRIESNNYQADEILKALKKVSAQTRTLSDIIMSRKNVTAKSIFHFVRTDINSLIKQTISLLTHEMPEYPVNIQFESDANNSTIKLDIFHIQQALLNLARNAIEAMRDSSTEEPKLLIEITKRQANVVEVSLFDNGPGLTQEMIPKLFEPHFTTKTYSIGLGLTVSRAIIEKHGGQLFALANPSGGACFGFTLPCVASN